MTAREDLLRGPQRKTVTDTAGRDKQCVPVTTHQAKGGQSFKYNKFRLTTYLRRLTHNRLQNEVSSGLCNMHFNVMGKTEGRKQYVEAKHGVVRKLFKSFCGKFSQ